MNKKGQMNAQLGMIIIVAVTLIVGVVFFQVIAQEVGSATSTTEMANQSLTAAAVNDTLQYITNCRALSSVIIFNATEDVAVESGNYTITNNVLHPTTGALCVSVNPTISAAPAAGYGEGTWTIDGTCQPLTYIADSGGRAVTNIIVIFFALAIAVVAISPTLRSGILEMGR